MLIADLKTPCKSCDGQGYQAGYNLTGSIHSNLKQDCHICSGNGYVLTELGEELWKLYRPMIQELIREELKCN